MEIAGRYTLVREVGRGGMSAVWLGTDQVLGRPVALKRLGLAPGFGTPDLERAEREARLAARLNHPHVVAIFDLVEEGADHWLVMEYVEGQTLAELVQREGPLSIDEAAPLLRQVADALAQAQLAGIVHRDVKPSNILVAEDGQVKLSDFGIARAEHDASLTQTGLVTGSPAYLAPEVASGQSATHASDVWSLGATAYHALAGKPPYEVGDNVMGALYRIVHEEPPRLTNAGWLGPMLEHTMTREPADRWPMAQVRDYLDGGPLAATSVINVPAERLATTVVETTPPPPPVPGDGGGTQVLAPAPPVAPVEPATRRAPGGLIIGLVATLAVIGLFLFFAWLLGAFDGNGGAGSGADSSPGGSTTTSSQDSPSSGGPSTGGSSSPPVDLQAKADAMGSFVTSYVRTAVEDPHSSWTQLTPDFQRVSGSFGQYQKFWSQWDSAEISNVTPRPRENTITYTVVYTPADGGRTVTNVVTLTLQPQGDTFLIASES